MRSIFIAVMLATQAFVAMAEPLQTEMLSSLELAVSNNAVALVESEKGVYLYSFLGLGKGKTWRDVSSAAWVLEPDSVAWRELEPVPGKEGRLAASAVSVGGAAWLFGGYTVAQDGSEQSTTGVYRIRPGETTLQRVTEMPVPVEDSVVLTYLDRYIYLVSGWHDLGNVNLVQVLDTQTMKWAQATPWPGSPVFGQGGGISANRMLVCDGVKIHYPSDAGPRQFQASDECWLGSIDAENYRRLNWRQIPAHPGNARYRLAVTANDRQQIVFAGGSANPYNFNGIGYNGEPAEPESLVFSYDLNEETWAARGNLPQGSMDHRGLLFSSGWYYLAGGMGDNQKTATKVLRFRLDE